MCAEAWWSRWSQGSVPTTYKGQFQDPSSSLWAEVPGTGTCREQKEPAHWSLGGGASCSGPLTAGGQPAWPLAGRGLSRRTLAVGLGMGLAWPRKQEQKCHTRRAPLRPRGPSTGIRHGDTSAPKSAAPSESVCRQRGAEPQRRSANMHFA